MAAQKTALITGITGQDGALLADFLLGKGYDVHGLRLYCATDDTQLLTGSAQHDRFHLHTGDLTDGGNLARLLADTAADEIYNLGAQSHVGVSFSVPEATAQINALGTLRLLEAVRTVGPRLKFYQASSSEIFGNAAAPQNEQTPMTPCSPYGAAKKYGHDMVRIYRQAYGLFACSGILFNHESAVRGHQFVTRKITSAVAKIAAGQDKILKLGNLDALRDWGHARDYVEGMWTMLQQDQPDDYVLATGQARSVRDFVQAAFACIGTTIAWRGNGLDETGVDQESGRLLVTVEPELFRPNELNELIGDASKAHEKFGWVPKTTFDALVEEMVAADRALIG